MFYSFFYYIYIWSIKYINLDKNINVLSTCILYLIFNNVNSSDNRLSVKELVKVLDIRRKIEKF